MYLYISYIFVKKLKFLFHFGEDHLVSRLAKLSLLEETENPIILVDLYVYYNCLYINFVKIIILVHNSKKSSSKNSYN